MIPQPAENSSQNSVTTSYPLPVQMAGRVSSVCSAVTKSGSVVTVSGSHVTYFPTCSGTCASLAQAHAVVVRDADRVQPLLPGDRDDLLQVEKAVGRVGTFMQVHINKHGKFTPFLRGG